MKQYSPKDELPWYANGTLDPAERTELEKYIESDPQLKAELLWLESLQENLQAENQQHSPEPGLAKLMARIRGERKSGV